MNFDDSSFKVPTTNLNIDLAKERKEKKTQTNLKYFGGL
jgi:hypothetical protein